MNTKLITYLVRTLTLLILCGAFSACQDTIPHRDTITPGKSTKDTPETPTPVARPDGAIKFKNDFCGCKDNRPVTYGNCTSFCANKNTSGQEIFYANFTVTEAISLSGFGSVYGWCTAVIDGDTQNPVCKIEAKDDEGHKIDLQVIPVAGSNSVTAVMDPLSFDKTYVLTLVETSSGARSNSIQTIKYSTDLAIASLGPLRIAPITQYTCLDRQYSSNSVTGDIYYDSAYRFHYYFLPRIGVSPIPAGQIGRICHDIYEYGPVDDVTYPRLEEIPGVFNLWDTNDPRFYDNDGIGGKDINQLIIQKVRNFGGGTITLDPNFFNPFSWMVELANNNNAAGNNTSQQTIGYYLAPFVDASYKSFCPTSVHYNGTSPLFRALRDIIGVDTEGLYIGETLVDSTGTSTAGTKDFILIREADLKAVWWYKTSAGVYTAPTDANVKDVPVYFHYPLNKNYPFVKTSTQKTYKVKWAYELGPNPGVIPASLPPHDRKIGCIPKF